MSRRLVVLMSVLCVAMGALGGFATAATGVFGLQPASKASDPHPDRSDGPKPHPSKEHPEAAPSQQEEPPVKEEEGPEPTPKPDERPPKLEIVWPKDGARFSEKSLRFKGVTEPGASVRAGAFKAHVDRKGRWSIALMLSSGGNRVVFKARDEAGNLAEASVTVYMDAPKEHEKQHEKDPKAKLHFTAHQKYGTCSEDPPYDIFWGTGAPGSTVRVTSEFGSGSTVVGDGGHWELKVTFPDAPIGEKFAVAVSSSQGGEKHFKFKRTE